MLSSGPFAALANRRRLLQRGGALSAAAAKPLSGWPLPRARRAMVKASSTGCWIVALSSSARAPPIRRGTSRTKRRPRWDGYRDGAILAQALFEDRQGRVRYPGGRRSHPEPGLGQDRHTIQFMSETRDRAQLVAFTIPYFREAVTLMFPPIRRTTPSRTCRARESGLGAAECVCRGSRAPWRAGRGSISVRFQRKHDPGLDSGRADASLADYSTALVLPRNPRTSTSSRPTPGAPIATLRR